MIPYSRLDHEENCLIFMKLLLEKKLNALRRRVLGTVNCVVVRIEHTSQVSVYKVDLFCNRMSRNVSVAWLSLSTLVVDIRT